MCMVLAVGFLALLSEKDLKFLGLSGYSDLSRYCLSTTKTKTWEEKHIYFNPVLIHEIHALTSYNYNFKFCPQRRGQCLTDVNYICLWGHEMCEWDLFG